MIDAFSISKAFERLNALPSYYIEIGVPAEKTKRKLKKDEEQEYVKVGITNAELMFIQENGSPINHIPARPVLQMTIDWANANLLEKTIDKCIDDYIESDFDINVVEIELKKMCLRMENYARDIIYLNDGRLTPNAPSTIAKKGDNHPLFDTGQLARSITCKLTKI